MRVKRGYQGPGGTGIARRCWAALRMDSLSPSHAARVLDSTVPNPSGNRVGIRHRAEPAMQDAREAKNPPNKRLSRAERPDSDLVCVRIMAVSGSLRVCFPMRSALFLQAECCYRTCS